MAVLVIADHDGSAVRDTTHKTVTAAKAISGEVDVLVLGKGAQAVADAAARIDGVRKVADWYRDAGVRDVTLELYPEGRHELLNDTVRDEVTDRVIGWLDEHLTTKGA